MKRTCDVRKFERQIRAYDYIYDNLRLYIQRTTGTQLESNSSEYMKSNKSPTKSTLFENDHTARKPNSSTAHNIYRRLFSDSLCLLYWNDALLLFD